MFESGAMFEAIFLALDLSSPQAKHFVFESVTLVSSQKIGPT